MAKTSIRLRLTLWYSAVLLLGLILFGSGMWFALGHRLLASMDARLAQRIQGLETVLAVESGFTDPSRLEMELVEFAQEVPEGRLMQLRDSHGRTYLPSPSTRFVAKEYASATPVYRTEDRDGRRFRILTSRIRFAGETYDVLVASSLDEVAEVMRDLRMLLLFMVPAVLSIACIGGYWISRRALAPVDEITRVARSISVQSLARRLIVPKTGDELQRMSETWNEVLERLDVAVTRIRQFTADASHELRTPLALIRATAELGLRRERSAAEYKRSLLEIQIETERMTELTETLLTLARADAASIEMPLTSTDLNEVVTDTVRQIESVAEAKGIRLKAEIANAPAVVAANAAAIRRLILALIDNAIKHTPRGGTVIVSTAPAADGGLMLAVQDTGEGIEPAALPHIFERFFRVDTARTSGSGVGLGLSIAQAIAQAHGTRIEVESKPGAGSRFELILRN